MDEKIKPAELIQL